MNRELQFLLLALGGIILASCNKLVDDIIDKTGTSPSLATNFSQIRPGSLALVVVNEIGGKLHERADLSREQAQAISSEALRVIEEKKTQLRLSDDGAAYDDSIDMFLGDVASGFMGGLGSINSDASLTASKVNAALATISGGAVESMGGRSSGLALSGQSSLLQAVSAALSAGIVDAQISPAAQGKALQALSGGAMDGLSRGSLISPDNAADLSGAISGGSVAGLSQVAAITDQGLSGYLNVLNSISYGLASAAKASDQSDELKTSMLSSSVKAAMSSVGQLTIGNQALTPSQISQLMDPIMQGGIAGISDPSAGKKDSLTVQNTIGAMVQGALQGVVGLGLPQESQSQLISAVFGSAVTHAASAAAPGTNLSSVTSSILGQTSYLFSSLPYSEKDKGSLVADVVSKSAVGLKNAGRGAAETDALMETMVYSAVSSVGQGSTLTSSQVASITTSFKDKLVTNISSDPATADLKVSRADFDAFTEKALSKTATAPDTSATNKPPSANAGSGQSVAGAATVTLDASLSVDPEGGALSYLWEQISGPTVVLSAKDKVSPTFSAPSLFDKSELIFRVTVSNGVLSDKAQVSIAVAASTLAPVVNIGANANLAYHQAITLAGDNSKDLQGGDLTYYWEQTEGIPLTFANRLLAKPGLTDDTLLGGKFTFKLSVNDGVNTANAAVSYTRQGIIVPSCVAVSFCPLAAVAPGPVVAMRKGAAVEAIVVWVQTVNTVNYLFKGEYRNGSWSFPTALSSKISVSSNAASTPHLAMDNLGNAVVVWVQSDGLRNQIYKAEYRSGTWTGPANLDDHVSLNNNAASAPKVAMDSNGNAIITWVQNDGSATAQVYKSEYRSAVWTKPSSLSDKVSPSSSAASSPLVAMDNKGNGIITWYQPNGAGTNQIFKSEYRAGVWSNPANREDNISPDGQSATAPALSMDNNGNAVIVWSQSDGTSAQIFKSEYRSGAWVHPANVTTNISPDGSEASAPKVGMDDLGNAIIVWTQANFSSVTRAFKSEYRGGAWTNPSSVNDSFSFQDSSVNSLQLAMDKLGNAVILWESSNGTANRAYASEYRISTATWSHPSDKSSALLNRGPGVYSSSSQVMMDNLGGGIAVWKN